MIKNDEIYKMLAGVTDPEVPVLSILDIGIVRGVEIIENSNGNAIKITITPTYSGCPAMDVIAIGIRMALANRGFREVIIINQISPAWTTDWMTELGKQKLKAYGIAPPNRKIYKDLGLFEEVEITCPRCGAGETELISVFGPTSCKALYKCKSCLEPFEYFKCH